MQLEHGSDPLTKLVCDGEIASSDSRPARACHDQVRGLWANPLLDLADVCLMGAISPTITASSFSAMGGEKRRDSATAMAMHSKFGLSIRVQLKDGFIPFIKRILKFIQIPTGYPRTPVAEALAT